MKKTVVRFTLVLLSLMLTMGCIKDPQFTPAEISISQNVLDLSKEAGNATIKVLSNRDWTVEFVGYEETPQWISLSQLSGTPSSDSVLVSISVLPNPGEDRFVTINFRTQTVYASLRVSQLGEIQKQYTPISQVRELYQGSNVVIEEDFVIKGTVISNYRSTSDGGLNNATSRRTLVVQDSDAGISLYLTENNTAFAFGDVLEIKLKGLELQRYNNGSLQVNALPNANINYLTNTNVEAIDITAAQLVSGEYESRYVAVADVQVADSDLGKTFVEDESHTSINFVSKTGEKFVLFSSGYSSYGAETVPSGSGVLKGIAMVYGSTNQISITSTADYAGLTGERFEVTGGGGSQPGEGALIGDYDTWNNIAPVTSFMDEFVSVTSGNVQYENPSWLFYSTDGSGVNTGWKTGVYNEDKYIQIAPYSSSADQVVAYALMPRADVMNANPKEYSFKKALYYLDADDGSVLEVVVSEDFAGDFEAATWEVVKNVSFPSGSEKNQWVEEVVDLSSYSSKSSLSIALRYTGKGNTYRIDDVKFGDGEQAPFFQVTPESKRLSYSAGTFTISVSSNVAWSVSSSNNAFSPSVTSGQGNATIVVSYSENTSYQERTGVITVSTSNPSISENTFTCQITQNSYGSGASGVYTSNVDIITGADETEDKAYVVDVITAGGSVKGLKLGTSSAAGTFTTPELGVSGDKELSMYVVAWNNKTCKLTVTVTGGGTINGSSSYTFSPEANSGARESSPFTIDYEDTDYYVFNLEGLTSSSKLTFSTTPTEPRCVMIGVNLN